MDLSQHIAYLCLLMTHFKAENSVLNSKGSRCFNEQ